MVDVGLLGLGPLDGEVVVQDLETWGGQLLARGLGGGLVVELDKAKAAVASGLPLQHQPHVQHTCEGAIQEMGCRPVWISIYHTNVQRL